MNLLDEAARSLAASVLPSSDTREALSGQTPLIDRNMGFLMSKFTTLCFGFAFAGLASVYAFSLIRYEWNEPSATAPILIEGPQRHLVRPEMLIATAKMTDFAAPPFRAPATDENVYDVKELTRDETVVLVFIKDGCPCSQAAQPFFNQLFDAYGKHARFFGVFDGSVSKAKKWATQYQAGFPFLSDPDLRIVHEYKAENSAYVALIAKGGTIDKFWPGYSVDMLADAAARLARLTGVVAKPIDVREAPTEMTTGCPY